MYKNVRIHTLLNKKLEIYQYEFKFTCPVHGCPQAAITSNTQVEKLRCHSLYEEGKLSVKTLSRSFLQLIVVII